MEDEAEQFLVEEEVAGQVVEKASSGLGTAWANAWNMTREEDLADDAGMAEH